MEVEWGSSPPDRPPGRVERGPPRAPVDCGVTPRRSASLHLLAKPVERRPDADQNGALGLVGNRPKSRRLRLGATCGCAGRLQAVVRAARPVSCAELLVRRAEALAVPPLRPAEFRLHGSQRPSWRLPGAGSLSVRPWVYVPSISDSYEKPAEGLQREAPPVCVRRVRRLLRLRPARGPSDDSRCCRRASRCRDRSSRTWPARGPGAAAARLSPRATPRTPRMAGAPSAPVSTLLEAGWSRSYRRCPGRFPRLVDPGGFPAGHSRPAATVLERSRSRGVGAGDVVVFVGRRPLRVPRSTARPESHPPWRSLTRRRRGLGSDTVSSNPKLGG